MRHCFLSSTHVAGGRNHQRLSRHGAGPTAGFRFKMNFLLLHAGPYSRACLALYKMCHPFRSRLALAGGCHRHLLQHCGAGVSVGILSSEKALLLVAGSCRSAIQSLYDSSLHMRKSTAEAGCTIG